MQPNVRAWLATAARDELFTSVLVVGEIRCGIERVRGRDPSLAHALEIWLAQLQRDFADRVLPIDVTIAEAWGRWNARATLSTVDGLLAATASVHGMTLVTRNVSGVATTGVPCLNPFE